MRIPCGIVALFLALSSHVLAQGRSPANATRGQSRAALARESSVQQALRNRQDVLDRVLDRTEETPRANEAASTRGNIPDVESLRRDALERVGAQTGTGRINRDVAGARARGLGNRPSRDRVPGMRGRGAEGLTRRDAALGRAANAERGLRGLPEQAAAAASRRPEAASRRPDENNRFARGESRRPDFTKTERLLAQRLASIDHLRDVAMRNGNLDLLKQADRLAELAQQQYDRRTTGAKMDVPSIFRRERPTSEEPTEPATLPTDPDATPVELLDPIEPISPTEPIEPVTDSGAVSIDELGGTP